MSPSDPTREQYIASEILKATRKLLEINDIKAPRPHTIYFLKREDLGDMYKILDSAVAILINARESGIYT